MICGWQVTTLWVNCPLRVNQLGQLSLQALRGQQVSSNQFIYMDSGDGDHYNGILALRTAVHCVSKDAHENCYIVSQRPALTSVRAN